MPQPLLRSLGRVLAEPDEIAANARSRSAILRVAERTDVRRCPPGAAPLSRESIRFPGRPRRARRAGKGGADGPPEPAPGHGTHVLRHFAGDQPLSGRASCFIDFDRAQAQARDLDNDWRRLQLRPRRTRAQRARWIAPRATT